MNELKSKRSQSTSQHRASGSTQRRVSFSRPWSQTRQANRTGSVIHRAKDKSNPVPRTECFSRPILSKPSLKSEKSISNASKGVSTRTKRDATSSTTSDSRRRSQTDSTPTHLKYGMFRRFSKVRRQSSESNNTPQVKICDKANEVKPALVRERSEMFRRQQDQEVAKERIAPVMRGGSDDSETPPLGLSPRHVNLSLTEPIHLDIKPKRFPSMLWC